MKQHKIAKKFEERVAADIGGRKTFMSGSGAFEKADVRSKSTYKVTDQGVVPTSAKCRFRVEAKTTSSPSYSFKVVDWDNVVRSSGRAGEEPVFAIEFEKPVRRIVIVRYQLAEVLGMTDVPYVVRDVNKSFSIRASNPYETRRLAVPAKKGKDQLIILPYDDFMYEVARYEVSE